MEESEKVPEAIEDNRILSRQSRRSTNKESRASSGQRHRKNHQGKIHREDTLVESVDSRSKTGTCRSDPDRDQISDGEGRRSDGSLYSEDYENATQSERSLSPFSQSLTPSPVPQRGCQAKQISRSPLHKLRTYNVIFFNFVSVSCQIQYIVKLLEHHNLLMKLNYTQVDSIY